MTRRHNRIGKLLVIYGGFNGCAFLVGDIEMILQFFCKGFDIIYGAQDYDFDTKNGIHSIPARFGVKNALLISRAFHVLALMFLIIVGILSTELGVIYYVGLTIISGLFILQHKLVSPENLKNVKIASYNINQVISIVFLICGVIDSLI